MILTIAGADFSGANIGTNTTVKVTYKGSGVTNQTQYIERGTDFNVTITLKTDYTYNSLSITVGGSTITGYTATDNGNGTISLSIPGNLITGAVSITVNATYNGSGETEPEEPGTGGGSGDSGETITGTLQLFSGAVSVVYGENYYRPANANTTRMNSSSVTEPTGVYVEYGYAITLTGVSGLRFDYIYAESAGPNSNDKRVNAIKGVGTASNFNASDYFPLNKTGESNTITITNNLGRGYYYHFAIAGPNKNEQLTPSDYNITYKIEPADTTKYTLIQGGINITPNESVFGSVLGSSDINYNKRGHTEPAIFIKNGESVTISGLTGLKLDAIWYNSPEMNNANAVGSASNKVSSNYFLLTDGNTDTYTYTNSTGSDYYYAFIVRNSDNTNFNASDYTLTIK